MKNTDTSITHITTQDSNIFEELGFSSQEASKLLHVSHPKASDVMCGKTGQFTIDALVDMLERTGKNTTLKFNQKYITNHAHEC
ncbi:MAG: XRE family transcriptional regulator [Mariprofundales bacterium]